MGNTDNGGDGPDYVMPDFKALLDARYGGEIDKNAGRFPGLHRYAVMLSNVAEGIAEGSIRVPR